MQPRVIADYACGCGEGPLWHEDEGRLYWIDISTGRLFRYAPADPYSEVCYTCPEGETIGGFTIQSDGALLLFMSRGAVKIWRNGAVDTVLEELADERATRFNDVIADPEGRVFCGTMPAPARLGRLYRLDPGGDMTRLLDGVGCSNGLGFTPDRTGLYFNDTPTRKIVRFDYDRATGGISNPTDFAVLAEDEPGSPDGLTVDAEGCVWSALWDGACVVRFDPEGHEERRIALPVPKVTSLTFGGPDYADLFITTAGGDMKDSDGAGALYHVHLGIAGVPEFRSRIETA